MTLIQYFAYGSNMLTERLRGRCKSATVRCAAAVDGYRLTFNKKSQDGSGKATIYHCQEAGSRVYGVVFDLDKSELPILDRFEGAGGGYDRVEKFRVDTNGMAGPLEVTTYIAGPGYTDKNLKPYDWYMGLVTAGAQEHVLPPEYVAAIKAVPSMSDPITDRPSRLEALVLLKNIPS